jgi:pyrroloquinoline-quinone synthase
MLRDALLAVMDRKTHPSWARYQAGQVSRAGVLLHLEQEFGLYLWDFPVLLGRVLGRGPPAAARAVLAETIYEEQTGGRSGTAGHAELFLRATRALGEPDERFWTAALLPEAAAFRRFLDDLTWHSPWSASWAVLGLFLEGGVRDRAVLGRPPVALSDAAVAAHPLARHFGVPAAAMEAVAVHVRLDAQRRHDAWRALEVEPGDEAAVQAAMGQALEHWLVYRQAVAARWEGR